MNIPVRRGKEVKAGRGTTLRCKGWRQEAILRLLENNVENGEAPDNLVIYMSIARAARDWKSFDRIVATLAAMREDETLIMQSGKPIGLFPGQPTTPLVIMAPIPLTLVGILPAHMLMGAFFTATSMIGFIAGAGIVVRNSIILVDFIELRLREGMPLDEAVIDAGAVRFRPMLLTAAAVVVGAGVILFDPIFQGLAIALMAGEVASLALSRMTVPIVYFVVNRRRKAVCQSNVTYA